jgi:pimeloyl-ACP methyl ester carboxylesterase
MAAEPMRITAPDGTEIAAYAWGTGQPLVAVSGTGSVHATWQAIRPWLEPHRRLYAVDRRGRGGSGDAPAYSLAHEYADIAAMVDVVARETGDRVDLLGHSYGGNVAFGAATRTANLRRLLLYEGWPAPNPAHRAIDPALIERFEDLLARGEPEPMLREFYRDIAGMASDEIDLLCLSPSWPDRVAAAGTVPRELRAFAADAFDPEQARRVTTPTILLVGEDSPDEIRANPEVVAGTLPYAQVRMLAGQGHIAHLTDPENFVADLLSCLNDQ